MDMTTSQDATSPAVLARNCPKCGTDNLAAPALAYSWQDWVLKGCSHCDFVYLENPPGYEALVSEFAWERNHGDRSERMREEYPFSYNFSRVWKKFRRWAIRKPNKLANRIAASFPPGPVVDIGCGTGDYLAALPADYEPLGVEISEELARRATERLSDRGGKVYAMSAIDGLAAVPAGTVSGIIMRSFLEHEQEPADLLARAWAALRPGGATIIKVPNYASVNRRVMGDRWCGFRFPGHVNYFTPQSLREMVEASGFRVEQFGLFDRFYLSDNMWMVASKPDSAA
ncbi:MAG: methyltransferase domain-containing protein [Alphaproteobacteria bacterium]|nr:methyltransferase domain-containing protein [Alphaproteobacteria bacterium]